MFSTAAAPLSQGHGGLESPQPRQHSRSVITPIRVCDVLCRPGSGAEAGPGDREGVPGVGSGHWAPALPGDGRQERGCRSRAAWGAVEQGCGHLAALCRGADERGPDRCVYASRVRPLGSWRAAAWPRAEARRSAVVDPLYWMGEYLPCRPGRGSGIWNA